MLIRTGKLSSLKEDLRGDHFGIFLSSASFEARCYAVAEAMGLEATTVAIVARNVDHDESNSANRAVLQAILPSVEDLPLYSDDPIRSADSIASVLGPLLAVTDLKLLVDITAFTREMLLILLAYFREAVSKPGQLKLVYACASEYSVGDASSEKWLSKGIRDVRTVLGYPGCLSPTRRNHLIVLMGFEDERAIELIRELEPTHVSLGLGDESDPATEPHQEANTHHFRRVCNIVGEVSTFRFSPYEPEATKLALEAQADCYSGCNVVVAPMNTKISTLGAALYAMDNDHVQLCYASANIYNQSRYSTPGDCYYLIEVDLPRVSS